MFSLNALLPSDFRAQITPTLRRFYFIVFVSCVGMGLTLSMYVVYLHNVRHFPISFATLLLAGSALLGIASSPLWGTAVDRFGPMWMAWIGYVGEAGALLAWSRIHTELGAAIVALFFSVLGGASWGPNATMLSRLVEPEHRQRAFGVNFMLVNLGIGFGGLIAASIVDLHHPSTFSALYEANASLMLLAGMMYLTMRGYGHHEERSTKEATNNEGWLVVLRDRRLIRFIIASIVLMIGGYGSQEAGFSLFVVNDVHLSVHVIGLIFFFNTSTIILSQLWVLNRIEGRSRMGVLFGVGVCWATFWLFLFMTQHLSHGLAIPLLCGGMVIFAIGETMMQPIGGALVNEIAPEHLRGRYNAALGLVWGVAGTLAPLVTALYFSCGAGRWWPLGTAACAVLGGVLMFWVRRLLNAQEDGRTPQNSTVEG